ncbi:hypothetical protein [Amycolatopsis sp. NPDC051371]|uniref:hypothetical protein n=1 Tax=Amycolatopsis sp. NPDC051371 TaxID=3155800 RepID=UPI0034330EE3
MAFAVIEARVAAPLLPLSIVRSRTRGTSYLVMLLAAVGMFSMYLFLAYYLQRTLGFSPVLAGVAFLPMAVSVAIGSPRLPGQRSPPGSASGCPSRPDPRLPGSDSST